MAIANQKPAAQNQSTAMYQDFMNRGNDARLLKIKQKLHQHLSTNKLSILDLFKFLDKDKSKGLTIQELTKGMGTILTEDEVRYLFLAVDVDKSGEITQEELI